MMNVTPSSSDCTNFRSKRKAVSTISILPPKKLKRTAKKAVMFAPGTKQRDGLLPTCQLLNDLVWKYITSHGSIRTPRDLLVFLGNRIRLLPAVITRIQDLILRISRARNTQMTPVLPAGGGRLMLLPVSKLGTVMLLLTLCRSTHNLLLQIYERSQSYKYIKAMRQTCSANESHGSEKLGCNSATFDESSGVIPQRPFSEFNRNCASAPRELAVRQ